MKKILFLISLIIGVSVFVVSIAFFFYSRFEYIDLVEKRIDISAEDNYILVIDKDENNVFTYSIEEWQMEAKKEWDSVIDKSSLSTEEDISPKDFVYFNTVSPFPENLRTIIFVVSTHKRENDYSLFWTLNIGTRELSFFGEKNNGKVGNIIWSPDGLHFAYLLNDNEEKGKYFTVDCRSGREKKFLLSSKDILIALNEKDENNTFAAGFQGIRWANEEEILFATKTLNEKELASWKIKKDGTNLERIDIEL